MKIPSSDLEVWEGHEFLELAESSAGIGIWDVDLATGMVRGRPQFFRVMGLEPTAEPVPIAVTRAIRHPEDRTGVIEGFQRCLETGTDYYESEYRIIWPDGQVRWILGRGRIVRDQTGKPVGYSGVDIDITDRKRIEEELRAAEARFMRVFQLAPIAMSISTLNEGRYVDVNDALLSQTGYSRGEIIGHTARELGVYVHEQDYGRIRHLLSENGSIKNLEIKLGGKSNERTVLLSADRLELAGEECLLTGSVDITERKDAEARQALLVRELQHRSKNLLAVVQSIVASTLRHSKDPAFAQNTILGRIQALARAQEFISAGPRGGARIDELIRAELAPFGGRVSVIGPPVIANSTFAQMFAMVVHELATNATKYGALSVEGGRIAISWAVRDDTFAFAWKEQGGPPATLPVSRGFGTQVITSALDGEPQITYDGDGFAYAITVPSDQLSANPSA